MGQVSRQPGYWLAVGDSRALGKTTRRSKAYFSVSSSRCVTANKMPPLPGSPEIQSLDHSTVEAPSQPADDGVLEQSTTPASEVPYSAFTRAQKRYTVFAASWAGFFSPVSSQIYYPALNTLAHELQVSNSLINLTLTSYMVGSVSRCWAVMVSH